MSHSTRSSGDDARGERPAQEVSLQAFFANDPARLARVRRHFERSTGRSESELLAMPLSVLAGLLAERNERVLAEQLGVRLLSLYDEAVIRSESYDRSPAPLRQIAKRPLRRP